MSRVESLLWCNSFRCSDGRVADADWKPELPLVQWHCNTCAHQKLCFYGLPSVWMLDKRQLQVLDSICSIPIHFYQIMGFVGYFGGRASSSCSLIYLSLQGLEFYLVRIQFHLWRKICVQLKSFSKVLKHFWLCSYFMRRVTPLWTCCFGTPFPDSFIKGSWVL